MSYVKLGQIADNIISSPRNIVGTVYIEDESGDVIVNNNPQFPLHITAEVISWTTLQDQINHGSIDAFNAELVTIPDQSISIRQSVFNQLISKYPTLVI